MQTTKKLLVISPYPPKSSLYGSQRSALASFAKNTLVNLKKTYPHLKILVLADQEEKRESYCEAGIKVKRVWQRNSFLSYFELLKESLKAKDYKDILLELEWALFGANKLLLLPLPLLIVLLKAFGKRVLVVSHGVVLDFELVAPQLGIHQKSFQAKAFGFGLKLFYALVTATSSRMIVLEQKFADLINQNFKTQKAVFIPHGVDNHLKKISQSVAKKKLKINQDEFLIVNFGFLTWYKGSDKLAKEFSRLSTNHPQKHFRLIFAGGPSVAHQNDPAYQNFFQKIITLAKKNNQILITGFIKEEEITTYFSAADLIVFPYRVFISSSGPLSLAFSFAKPVLLSAKLTDYFISEDMRRALQEAKLTKREILTSFCANSLADKLAWGQRKNNLTKLADFSVRMALQRSWKKVAQIYYQLIFC